MCVKVAQLCPTHCHPMDSTVHGILQARILEWVAFLFSEDLPNPGIEPRSPALQVDSLPAELPGKPHNTHKYIVHTIVISHLGSTSLLYSSPFILTGFGILIRNMTLYSPLVLDEKIGKIGD